MIRPTRQQLAIGLAGIFAVLLVGVGVAFVLKGVMPKKLANTPQPSIATAPPKVIAGYEKAGVIKSLSDSSYLRQADNETVAYIRYKLDGHDYTISTPTKNQVLFYAKTKSQPDDTIAIQDQTTAFMHAQGYEKLQTPSMASSADDVAYVTYAGPTAICQLTDSPALPNLRSYHALACADKTVINQEYATTEKLMAIYKQDRQPLTFKEAVRSTIAEDDKSLSILSLTNVQAHPVLLFAAIGNNWTYIGDLNNSKGQESNGKYIVTPEIKQAISDPKYGDFLLKNIQ
jgi:hypothetical protein